MRPHTDEDVLKHIPEQEAHRQQFASFTEFRKQFDAYLRAKTGHQMAPRVCRPYIKAFRLPRKEYTRVQ